MASSPESSVCSGAEDSLIAASRQPSRPLYTVPVSRPPDVSQGDHIIYLITSDNYRPIYQSALVENVTDGNVNSIVYTPGGGVKSQVHPFQSFKSLHRVDYSSGCGEEAIQRAKERLGEAHYHGLFNNSHHLVSWAKTGTECTLTDLIYGLEGSYGSQYSYQLAGE